MRPFKDELRALLAELLECETGEIADDADLSTLGFDSLKFISAVVKLETVFSIEILDSDLVMEHFQTVNTIAALLSSYLKPEARPLYKCLITDGDGVLWGGIAGEGGDDAPYFGEHHLAFCALLHGLRKKGVLLAVCSKNEEEAIAGMLASSPLALEDIAILEAETMDKAAAIGAMLKEFGFSPDQAVYIEDSDAELAFVCHALPSLCCIKAGPDGGYVGRCESLFASLPDGEGLDRTAKFREQKEREKVHVASTSPEEYNRILNTEVLCGRAGRADADRLSELSLRANRFNLTDMHCDKRQILSFFGDPSYAVYRLSAKDKCGDMGIVAMAVVREQTVEGFILSCRVFGRGFEGMLLDKILAEQGEVTGLYRPSEKNAACREFYQSYGVKQRWI